MNFTEISLLTNQFAFFQAKNVVEIIENTNPPLQKLVTRTAKVPPKSPNFLNSPFRMKVQNYKPTPPPFRRGVQAMKCGLTRLDGFLSSVLYSTETLGLQSISPYLNKH